jgi:hypothetical protein
MVGEDIYGISARFYKAEIVAVSSNGGFMNIYCTCGPQTEKLS